MYNKNIDSQDVKSFNHAVGELQSLRTLESLGSREPSAIFSPYQKKGKSASGALDQSLDGVCKSKLSCKETCKSLITVS